MTNRTKPLAGTRSYRLKLVASWLTRLLETLSFGGFSLIWRIPLVALFAGISAPAAWASGEYGWAIGYGVMALLLVLEFVITRD